MVGRVSSGVVAGGGTQHSAVVHVDRQKPVVRIYNGGNNEGTDWGSRGRRFRRRWSEHRQRTAGR
jgi:hypothetical protein